MLFYLLAIPSAAFAGVGAAASVYSDYQFRGYSLSDYRPVGIVDLSYDAPDGLYGAASGSVVWTRHEGLKPLGLVLNAGYAKPLSHGLTADFGVLHASYSHYSGVVSGRSYTEVYAGISGKLVGARISISPNYFGPASATVRPEINAHADLGSGFTLEGEAGALMPLGGRVYGGRLQTSYDARVGVSRRSGRFSFHVAASARSGGRNSYYAGARRHAALIVGISTAL